MNVEHRTSNIERRIMYSIYFKSTERSLRLAEIIAPTPRRANPSLFIIHYSIVISW
ncbi:hypothetical protein D1AOALGA4SA_11605 [Olavius algarvensis Delta 1 endosymbiont]|nr:hypothetical protein D1AOALGA4SA_11605 [Olavius algarvensis Delta 1 endosymbiont]